MKCVCKPIHSSQTNIPSLFVDLNTFQLLKQKYNAVGINALSTKVSPCIHEDDISIDYNLPEKEIIKQMKRVQSDVRTPIVVYCAKESCNASHQLLNVLSKHGYCNFYYMKDGVEGARNHMNDYLNLFSKELKNNIM